MARHRKPGAYKVGIALFLVCSVTPLLAQQVTRPSQTGTESPSQTVAPPASQSIQKPELPDSPGATATQQTQNATPVQQPTGTAAAQQGKISGSALSEPAGVAIAPAKQKRVRSILIKMGFIAGAGIALGTVAALSSASPSKPPGAQ